MLLPWSRGKPLAIDVTLPDTYAASHIQATAKSAGAAAESAAVNKTIKYNDLMTTHILYRSQLKQVEHGVTNLLSSLKTLVGESI